MKINIIKLSVMLHFKIATYASAAVVILPVNVSKATFVVFQVVYLILPLYYKAVSPTQQEKEMTPPGWRYPSNLIPVKLTGIRASHWTGHT